MKSMDYRAADPGRRSGWKGARSWRSSTLVLALALAVLAAQPVAGQRADEGEIRGRVVARDSTPLSGAVVEILGTPRGTVTDPRGEFRIGSLRRGDYRLRARMIGFRDQEVSATIPAPGREIVIVLESTPLQLPEVVATANPIGGGVTNQAADVLEGEALDRRPAASVGSVLETRPGVSARSFGPAPARPVIRGFDGERVVVLENGERMGDTQERAPDDAVSLDPLAIERIEIVRGPASLLYGSSALGGVVNLLTRDAPAVWGAGLTGDVALDAVSVNGMLAASTRLTYGDDRWAVSGRLSHRDAGDATTPSGPMPNSHLRTTSGAAGLAFQAEALAAGLSVGVHSQRYGIPEFAVAVDDGGLVEVEPDGEVSIERLSLQGRGEWISEGFVRNVQLRASGHLSRQQEGDADEDADDEGADEDEVEQEIETGSLGVTLLARHRPLGILSEGVIGVNLRLQNQEIGGLEAYHPGQRLVSLAGYFFEEAPLSPTVRLQFGGRIEKEWLRTLANRFFDEDQLESASAVNLSSSVGLNFRPLPAIEIGVQAARAHRNPTVVERYASGWDVGAARVEIGDPSLRSEVGHGLDFFTRIATGRVGAEVALFSYWIGDFVTLRPLPPGCGGIEYRVRPDRDFPPCVRYTPADARMMGGELSLDLLITRTLTARSQLDYVRGDRIDGEDEPLAYVTPARALVGIEYDDSRLLAGATARLVGAQRRVAADELPTKGYALVDVEAGYRFTRSGSHLATIRIGNALDRSYSDHLSVIRRYPEPVSPDNPVRFDMPGRTIDLGYRYTF